MSKIKTLYDFKVQDIDNMEFNMAILEGKKVLIVNVASECGLTPQYKELEDLYVKNRHKGFIVIGFPSNDFRGQEPGTNAEIKQFCEDYNITFPIMAKVSVNGPDIAPIYKWLTRESENGKFDAVIDWNFQKFMISENGQLVNFIAPTASPLSDSIVKWIDQS
ncbi:glutathione peroxidase [Dysgonomonas sp. ZJ279]|uniref:glutathione peroxidase n=1 Tax=Dysgonomonas sp. ZJ279 TaxID=2709796 RepID=UPI0013EC9C21|nr:glutathione peroxidase [Dysgonomonas sp. ZJ279]